MRTLCVLLVLSVMAAAAVSAQTRADLRYVAHDSVRVTYSAAERTASEVVDEPGSARSSDVRTRYELTLSPLDDALIAALAVTQHTVDGALTELPEPVEQTITARGPRPDPTDERSLDALLTVGPLLYLPGREVELDESWTDTVAFNTERDGVLIKVRSIITGTYAGDTIVDGRTLNVLRYVTADIMATEAQRAGMTLIGSTSGGRREIVLWDSQRHVLVYREAEREASLEMETLTGPRTTLERTRVVLSLVEVRPLQPL